MKTITNYEHYVGKGLYLPHTLAAELWASPRKQAALASRSTQKKMLTKIWKSKQDLMIILVFSSTEEGLKFFSESFSSIKGKSEKNLHLILSGKIGRKTKIKSDLLTDKLEDIIQWSQTKFENL